MQNSHGFQGLKYMPSKGLKNYFLFLEAASAISQTTDIVDYCFLHEGLLRVPALRNLWR